jgi:hypothetical protein
MARRARFGRHLYVSHYPVSNTLVYLLPRGEVRALA